MNKRKTVQVFLYVNHLNSKSIYILGSLNAFTKWCGKKWSFGVSIVAQQVKNLPSIHEDADWIPGLAEWVKDLALPWAVGCRHSLDLALLWLCVGWKLQFRFHPYLGTSICRGCSSKTTKKKDEVVFYFFPFFNFFLIYLFIIFLGPHPWHMEVPRLGVRSEL